MSPPEFDQTPFPAETANRIRIDFQKGLADRYKPNDLVRAGVVSYHPLHGGIFTRREEVKYIIVHSTETGPPVSATSVIDSWSSLGRRHAGAQYVVERDGHIYQSCEPDMATVHVNIFKTLPGINNDNSIGIEMNHTGRQTYPREQRESVKRLVSYLQDRYHVVNENVITHRYAQQGDHTDPVLFDFEEFLATKDDFHNHALAMKRDYAPTPTTVVTTTTTATVTDQPTPTETALTPKDSGITPPTVSDIVPPLAPDVVGAPLPGPPVLRKELELNPSDAQHLEDELEPMQNVP
jgi:hypothetical protein